MKTPKETSSDDRWEFASDDIRCGFYKNRDKWFGYWASWLTMLDDGMTFDEMKAFILERSAKHYRTAAEEAEARLVKDRPPMTALELNEQWQKEISTAHQRYYAALTKLQKTCEHPEISRWENAIAYDVKRCKVCNLPVEKRINEEYAKTGMVTKLDLVVDNA